MYFACWQKKSIIVVQLLSGSKFSIGHVWTQEASKYKSIVATSWCWFGYFWLFFSSSPSSWSAVCQSSHSLSREEFSPVIHPSCGRLHGQLKKNCLARPKRGDHMLQSDLPSALPLSPLGPHLWGFRGHSACGFFRNGPGRKTQRLQTNRTISLSSDWVSPPEQPPTRSPRLRPTSTPTVEGSCQWGDLPPCATSPLHVDRSVICFVGGEGWRLKPQGNHRADGMDCFGRWLKHISAAVTGLWCYCLRTFWMWGWVRMCIAGDRVEKRRSDISKQGRSVRLVKWGYEFIIISRWEREATLNQNKIENKCRSTDGAISCYLAIVLSVTLICVYPCVWLSVYPCWCLQPRSPRCLFSLLSPIGVPPPLTSGAWNWSNALSSHNAQHKQEI